MTGWLRLAIGLAGLAVLVALVVLFVWATRRKKQSTPPRPTGYISSVGDPYYDVLTDPGGFDTPFDPIESSATGETGTHTTQFDAFSPGPNEDWGR